MRVVITGPTGAIGHALIEHCLKNGDEVLAICHRNSRRIQTLPQSKKLQILELNQSEFGSFADNNPVSEMQYDVFYHFAWDGTAGESRDNMPLQSDNIKYSLDAVKLAKSLGCNVFIGAGSQAEYGRVEGILTPDTPAFPENGYGMAKLCAGRMTRILCDQLGMKHIWVRILSIYGPYDGENSMVISSLRKMLKGEEVLLTEGRQKWDYLYSGDAANALLLIAQMGRHGKTYILGSGSARPLKEYVQIMLNQARSKSVLKFGAIPYLDKQVMYLCADISGLKEDTGFTPQISFEEGIANTIQYLKENVSNC